MSADARGEAPPSISMFLPRPRRSASGLPSRLPDHCAIRLRRGESLVGVLADTALSLCESSSSAGLLSLLLTMPKRCSSSSIAGLPSRLFRLPMSPPGLLLFSLVLSGLSYGRLGLFFALSLPGDFFKQLSKHSAQDGRPMRSTIGVSPIFLKHDSQQKHRLCHTRPEFSTNPPSLLSMSTGRSHEGQSPFDPPFVVKHGRQRNRLEVEEAFGSGYIVASGGNVDEHMVQE